MSNKLLTLMRLEIVEMNGYRSARNEQSKDQGSANKIWLDANENPWDSESGKQYNRYPEPQPYSLVTLLSSLYNVDPKQILITRGSDEGIDLLTRLFCRAGQDKIMICPPTYGVYKVAATIQGAEVVEVPLLKSENFSLDPKAILARWQPNIKLIFLCSPNNPTGNLLAVSDILTICKQLEGKAIVIVDEAYIEFSLTDSLSKYLSEYSNLVILRTLSKAYGLAGIRCGVTMANPVIIQTLKKVIAPYPISKAVTDIVCQQLNLANVNKQVQLINQEKKRLFSSLVKLPCIKKVWESKANFLLFETCDATKVMEICFKHGVVPRDRSREFSLKNCIRITIGTPSENQLFLEALSYV
jgi:histidinol-phosphate aminotransferase